jgi:hypothetical protein
MPSAYSVLGQSAPSATTLTTLYTVPASTSSVVSSITVCNRGTNAASFRIAVRPAGAAISNEHYVVYDGAIAANDMLAFTLGITLATTDVISVYASTANLSFQVFGSQIT